MRASRKRELCGNRFNNWLVTKEFKRNDSRVVSWLCICKCGKEKYVRAYSLTSGASKSCGCDRNHGKTRSPTYKSWQHMKARCDVKRDKSYLNYGGRGITYCKRWSAFQNFLKDMGECPKGLTLERGDNNKQYNKGNCTWESREQQSRNRRNTLDVDTVACILTMFKYGERICDIARGADLDKTKVRKICRGITWKGQGALPI